MWNPAEDLEDSIKVGLLSKLVASILPANRTSPFKSNLTLIRRFAILLGLVSKIFESSEFRRYVIVGFLSRFC